MQISIYCINSYLTFLNARRFLKKLQYKPNTLGEVNALRPLFPFDQELELKIKNSSLTHNIDLNEQIRFLIKDAILEGFLSIGKALSEKYEKLEIILQEAHVLRQPELEFFKSLAQFPNISLKLISNIEDLNKEDQEYEYTDEEIVIQRLLGYKKIPFETRKQYIHFSQKLIRAHDIWLAKMLIEHLMNDGHKDPEVYTEIAHISALLGEHHKAEFFCRLAISNGSTDCQIANYYTLAMLYLRGHSDYLKNEKIAEDLLDKALSLIETNVNPNKIFQKVFNRNGYALILYRKGQHQNAINILKWGINELSKSSKERDIMHKSVLLFNLAQCQTAMKLFPESIETYKELISIDPYDADYKIKLAEILIINESYEEALSQLLKAENINPSLQSIFVLIEECLSNQSNKCINKRIEILKKALTLKPNDFDIRYNLCSLLLDVNKPEQCIKYLKSIDKENFSIKTSEDLNSLLAEAYLKIKRYNDSLSCLRKGIRIFPESQLLYNNLDEIMNFSHYTNQ